MRQRPFLFFLLIIAAWTTAAIWYIQTPRFARLFKSVAAKYIPGDLGVDADFSEFSIKLFPPGISLQRPKIALRDRNILKMPAGSRVEAERIDLIFQPFQMFSGDIRIHEAVIVNGDAKLVLSAPSPHKNSGKQVDPDFHWDELFQVRAEAIAVQNTRMQLVWVSPVNPNSKSKSKAKGHTSEGIQSVEFLARSLRLSQWSGKGGLGYEAQVDVGALHSHLKEWIGESFPMPEVVDEVRALAHVNRAGAVLDEFSVTAQGLSFHSSGKIKGDILSPKASRNFEMETHAEGDLKRLFQLVQKPAVDLEGYARFSGKLRGNLDLRPETFRAEGTFQVEKPGFNRWHADHLSLEGSWAGASEGGELTVAKGLIQAAESERVIWSDDPKGGKPATGGEIEIGTFKVKPAALAALRIPLTLKKAHIHWLAASAVESLYALLFRVTGPAHLTYLPATNQSPWQVQAKVGLGISDFQLDNQKMGLKRPMKRILKIPKLTLDGGFVVDAQGVRPAGLAVEIARSKFNVEGKVDFKSGYDLHINGQASLAEVGEIAENPIRGDGPMSVHVHGPGSNIVLDFDADLQDAMYLRMYFGNLKGRVTWDDDPNHLILSGLRVTKGETLYSGEGLVDLGNQERIDIKVNVPNGNIHDLFDIFRDMTQDFWWFPKSLVGAVSGEVNITGGVSLNEMRIKTQLTGRSWDYLNERLDQVNLSGGYDRGTYSIGNFNGTKNNGKISGKISFEEGSRKLDWEIHTQQLTLSDLDHFAQLDVPIRGKVSIDSIGSGPQNAIRSETRASVTDFSVRGAPLPASHLLINSVGGKMEVRGDALEGQGTLDVSYDFHPGEESSVRAELRHLDFSPILLLLNPRTIPDPAVAGFGSGSANLSFRSGAIDRANGEISIREYTLAKTGNLFRLMQPVSFKVNDGSFDLGSLSIAGNKGETTLRLKGRQADLEGTISGSLDVSVAEFFTSSVSQSSGVALLDFAIAGSLKTPSLSGRGILDGVSFRVPSVESPFENVTGTFQVRQNSIFVHDFQADLAGGRVLAEGSVTVFADRYPSLALTGSITGSRIKVYPFQFAKVRGNLSVHGNEFPYVVDGSINVDSALSKESMLQQKTGPGLRAVRYTPPPSLRRMADYPRFNLNIDVKSEGGLVVQNDLFDTELKAQVKVVNTLEAPRIVGNVDVLQGFLIFKDRKFQIQSATAVFDNPTVLNPRFNLTASTDISWVKVQLYASGRVGGVGKEQMKVELSSNPSMPESEIISLIAMGMTANETKKLNPNDRTVFEQGEAASLLLHSLDFNREVESKTGLQIQLDESVNAQQGSSVSRLQSATETGAAPKIVIKKQLTKNLDVSYGSTIGVGTSSQREVNAEIKVTPGFSVIGVWDSYEAADPKDKQTSYGMDLKIQKRFK